MYLHFLGLKNTAEFHLIKLHIMSLLNKRDRQDLIPVWEDFLDKFPEASVDPNVPCEDIYGELLRDYGGTAMYVTTVLMTACD